MNKPENVSKEIDLPDVHGDEEGFALGSAYVDSVLVSLADGDMGGVRDAVLHLHYADAADLLERLSSDQRHRVLEAIRDDFDPEILSAVDETVRDEIVDILGLDGIAAAVAELDSDDAVLVVEELEKDEQQHVLDSISHTDRAQIEESLSFPEDSAGRLMQRELMAVPQSWTVGETIDFMRASAEQEEWDLPEVFYDIFVVDEKHAPVGTIPLSAMLTNRRPIKVADIMHPEMKLIPAEMDQEDVAFLFRQRDLVSAPVINREGRLVGAITIDDVVDVIDEEHEEDIMRLGGVSEDDLYSATLATTRARFTWLVINLGTAVLASMVIGMFEATLEQMVALAVLMPIVASMGGNAGTQTLTVAVRALATRELTPTNAMRQVGKEFLVGIVNGVLFAILAGGVAWFWFDSSAIGGVIAMAMIVNMIVAGLAGTTIPIFLERVGIDPAVASAVFLTTITDVVGFFAFLGLAALFLL